MGIIAYEHTFSSNVVADFRGMVRDNSNDFYSNAESTPIEILQHNWLREGYFKGSLTISHGRHEIKAGVESDNLFLNEKFHYHITDDSEFDPSTPLVFDFGAHRPDLEQSAYVEDLIRLGNWTINAGLRWDHYQLILNNQAISPRLAVSRYFRSAGVVVHFSYDRVFQTPSFENMLLSSSTAAAGLNTISLQLPVRAVRRKLLRGRNYKSVHRQGQAGRGLLPAPRATITPMTIRSKTRRSATRSHSAKPSSTVRRPNSNSRPRTVFRGS